MKNLFTLFYVACFTGSFNTLSAQEPANNTAQTNPIYEYAEQQLNNTDTIPGFETMSNKLKITGTIYQSDGETPAKDVLLYIEQADENGDYQIKTKNNKRYMQHRAWIKTNADGQYTFYTFVPGAAYDQITYPRRRGLKKIYPIIKASNKPEYNLDALLFDNDPKLTKSCRKRLKRKGIDNILEPEKQGGLLVVTRDIVLEETATASK
jgi:protocatechuate 3,4-dioxygenase beta subunit